MNTKVCSKCGTEKDISEFHNDKYTKDGLRCQCIVCVKQYYKSNTSAIAERQKQYYKNNVEPIAKRMKQWYKNNIELRAKQTKRWYKDNTKSTLKRHKQYNKNITLFKSYSKKLETFEEIRCCPENSELLEVKCAYCGKWMKPTNRQVSHRFQVFNGTINGERRFYCSEACKQSCPSYNQDKHWKGQKQERIGTSREVDAWFRQHVLKTDNWTCQICGRSKDEYSELVLHVHHILGVAQEPMLQNDIDNAITLCIDCHKEVHKIKSCTYFDLRRPKCKKLPVYI